MNKIIYLDNASTTKVDEEVLKTYERVSLSYFGNASSIHRLGIEANDLLEKARAQILSLLKLEHTHDLIFTSGATEANNLVLKGYMHQYKNRGNHLIVSSIEHPSILEAARSLEKEGFDVTYLPVNEQGIVDIDVLKNSIKKETILVSVMVANNETGAIQPIEEIVSLLKEYPKIMFHTDAVQAIGKIDKSYNDVDMITLTSHKIHGLKGVGALIKRKSITFDPILSGGGQESGLRSGTNDVANCVSFAKAMRLTLAKLPCIKQHIQEMHDRLMEYFKANPDMYIINSFSDNPFVVNVSLKNKKAAVVVEGLSKEGIMISSISACHSKVEAYSYVVYEMSKDETRSRNTLRISLDYNNTMEEIEEFIHKVDSLVRGIRQ